MNTAEADCGLGVATLISSCRRERKKKQKTARLLYKMQRKELKLTLHVFINKEEKGES